MRAQVSIEREARFRRRLAASCNARDQLQWDMHYLATRAALEEAAAALFDALAAGIIRSSVNHTYPLSEAVQAHRAIHERRTTGSSVLLPFA